MRITKYCQNDKVRKKVESNTQMLKGLFTSKTKGTDEATSSTS